MGMLLIALAVQMLLQGISAYLLALRQTGFCIVYQAGITALTIQARIVTARTPPAQSSTNQPSLFLSGRSWN